MKLNILLTLGLILCIGCNENTTIASEEKEIELETNVLIESVEVLKEDLELNQIEGRWYYKGEAFSGYSVKFHENDTLGERLGYVNGKREGLAQKWSESGLLRVESYYKHNRLDSIYKTWWENAVPASQLNYDDGVKQGIEKDWYPTGVLAKERSFVDGSENGLQKAWLPNGKLYVNYEARNGRIFGMRRANSCYELEDEKIVENETF
jgi:antitoxin component YwqK of YwqJK toxin-antitoxin module